MKLREALFIEGVEARKWGAAASGVDPPFAVACEVSDECGFRDSMVEKHREQGIGIAWGQGDQEAARRLGVGQEDLVDPSAIFRPIDVG